MKAELFSIVAGSAACNARCPFCVSKMTPPNGIDLKEPEVDWEAFEEACKYVKETGCDTAMITSKGEPTLFPDQITKYLEAMKKYNFSSIDLQTNGIWIAEHRDEFDSYLSYWHDLGLSTIAISMVHYDPVRNREIYVPYKKEYIDLPDFIKYLHDEKRPFTVRLACIMLKDYVDSPEELRNLMHFAKENNVEQLTARPVNKPDESADPDVAEFVEKHRLTDYQIRKIHNYLENNGSVIKKMPYGATIYDVDGQNVCLTNSLTYDAPTNNRRQLIFFPDGTLRYDWQRPDAIIDLKAGKPVPKLVTITEGGMRK